MDGVLDGMTMAPVPVGPVVAVGPVKPVHKCKDCGRVFKNKSNLTNHSRTHRRGPIECSVCSWPFKTWKALRSHMLTHAKPAFECDVCHKCFTTMSSLTRHMGTHHFLACHDCPYCAQSFSRADHLKIHLAFHETNETNAPYVCPTCGPKVRFAIQTHLARHMRTHGR